MLLLHRRAIIPEKTAVEGSAERSWSIPYIDDGDVAIPAFLGRGQGVRHRRRSPVHRGCDLTEFRTGADPVCPLDQDLRDGTACIDGNVAPGATSSGVLRGPVSGLPVGPDVQEEVCMGGAAAAVVPRRCWQGVSDAASPLTARSREGPRG